MSFATPSSFKALLRRGERPADVTAAESAIKSVADQARTLAAIRGVSPDLQ